MYSKHRLEALSDGIFAIVMTLLVLDLKVPEDPLPHHFGIHLAEQWISFFLTFMIASIFWALQHQMFALIEDLHAKTLIPTFVFLGLVSVLPFSTALLGHHIDRRSSFIVYYGHTFLIALALIVKLHLLLRLHNPADTIGVELLKLRLYTMGSLFGLLTVACTFVPVRWVGLVAALAAVLSRRLTKPRKDRLTALRESSRLIPPGVCS